MRINYFSRPTLVSVLLINLTCFEPSYILYVSFLSLPKGVCRRGIEVWTNSLFSWRDERKKGINVRVFFFFFGINISKIFVIGRLIFEQSLDNLTFETSKSLALIVFLKTPSTFFFFKRKLIYV